MRVQLVIPTLAALLAPTLNMQAEPNCPAKPRTIAAMRSCARPLLVFAPGAENERFRAQVGPLEAAAAGMVDRQMLLVPVLASGQGYREAGHAPVVELPLEEQAELRRRLGVETGEFRVVLLGKDGGEKLASGEPVAPEILFGTVDAMPMRQQEQRRTQAFGGSRQGELRRAQAREASQGEEARRERARDELRREDLDRERAREDSRQRELQRARAREDLRQEELRRERPREQARHN